MLTMPSKFKITSLKLLKWNNQYINYIYIVIFNNLKNSDVLKELKIIKTKTFESIEKDLNNKKYFSGDKFGILDILVYVRIRKYISIEKHSKIV